MLAIISTICYKAIILSDFDSGKPPPPSGPPSLLAHLQSGRRFTAYRDHLVIHINYPMAKLAHIALFEKLMKYVTPGIWFVHRWLVRGWWSDTELLTCAHLLAWPSPDNVPRFHTLYHLSSTGFSPLTTPVCSHKNQLSLDSFCHKHDSDAPEKNGFHTRTLLPGHGCTPLMT